MAQEADHYTVDEAARILEVSPARVRQMLRAGQLEGERRGRMIEGVPGPWRIPASAVRSFEEHRRAAETTTAAPPGEATADAPSIPSPEATGTQAMPSVSPGTPSGGLGAETPSGASELLSEGVRDLRERVEALLEDLERLEVRLEAAEVETFVLREALRREKERADRELERAEGLRGELKAEQARRRGERRGSRRGTREG
jgi:hypothetical protein